MFLLTLSNSAKCINLIKRVIIPLYNVNIFVLVTEANNVYCEVRNESLTAFEVNMIV